MKSTSGNRFSNVPNVNIPRSTFDRSHGYKTTFDAGYLIPIYIDEALPGDTFRLNLTGFSRLSTPIYPVMDNMIMDTFFFAVPHRLIWDNWQKFCGEQVDPGDSIDYTVPIVNNIINMPNESLWDYLGIPTKVASQFDINAFFSRAYNKIYNDWFRDENLQDSVVVDTDNGPDDQNDYVLLRRGKRHDYFTSALPWLQKGDSVLLSLGTEAPVLGIGTKEQTYAAGPISVYETGDTGTQAYADYKNLNQTSDAATVYLEEDPDNAGFPNIRADLTQAIGPSVNEFRQAVQVQRILEKDARGGTRYTEIVKSHFGVTSPDSRLQRAEYLGGGSTPVTVAPVARTDTAPGTLGAYGQAAFSGHGFEKSFTEHSVVIGLVCVRADLTYQEGLERHWSRQTRYDYYWPTLAHLGEQAILNKEIYIDSATIASGASEEVFGYQERFAEMRYKPSRITGKFRSNDAASLDAWHLGIEFGSQPTLDEDFIVEDPPIDRIIATPTEPHFIYDSYLQLQCTRPMPTYAIPGLVDHF